MNITKSVQICVITATFLLSVVAIPSVSFSQAFKAPAANIQGTWLGPVEILAVHEDRLEHIGVIRQFVLRADVRLSIDFHEGNFFLGKVNLIGNVDDTRDANFEGGVAQETIIATNLDTLIQGTVIGKKIRSTRWFTSFQGKIINDQQIRVEFDSDADFCIAGEQFCEQEGVNFTAVGVLTRQ